MLSIVWMDNQIMKSPRPRWRLLCARPNVGLAVSLWNPYVICCNRYFLVKIKDGKCSRCRQRCWDCHWTWWYGEFIVQLCIVFFYRQCLNCKKEVVELPFPSFPPSPLLSSPPLPYREAAPESQLGGLGSAVFLAWILHLVAVMLTRTCGPKAKAKDLIPKAKDLVPRSSKDLVPKAKDLVPEAMTHIKPNK